ncbi:MAG: AIR synthase-related protein [Myxococcota bacterium]
MTVHRLEIQPTPLAGDALAAETAARLRSWAGIEAQRVQTRRIYHLDLGLQEDEAATVLAALTDPVAETGSLAMLDDDGAQAWAAVGFKPGVTDTVGASVKRAAEDCLGRSLQGNAYASTLYLFWGVDADALARAATAVLCNPVIETVTVSTQSRTLDRSVPKAGTDASPSVKTVPLRTADDETLAAISRDGMLALSLAEMKAIAVHFEQLGRDPNDAELECLAQTWSEHCKHKIFAAPIDFEDDDGSVQRIEKGLFRTFIRGATESIAEARLAAGVDPAEAPFLVSVFHDNAGVVRFTEDDHLVYKVETHNSPSALDPYGGAMTGIVGVNRDSFGTGRGADLLTNVWGYCFARPDFDGSIPAGLMHPRRIRDGVHRGVVDGGNQSGVPYSRGFELFDDRYLGKPLVYCGTAAVMPAERAGVPTHEKPVEVGHHIVMLGGRIGKDGIHGATFSSAELDENAPVQAVQIGDPITQKMMFDMLAEARDAGLLSGMTDNGAGGLSSSIGEMAEFTGGAQIDLARAPLKYPGLEPWEILISEAQERMSVAVPPEHLDAFMALATRREVDATDLGTFTDSGRFVVTHGETPVVDLTLEFLHEGWVKTPLRAKLDELSVQVDGVPEGWRSDDGVAERLDALLGSPEEACAVDLCRSYDHEVKGLSVVKPWIGVQRDVRSTATVMRTRHGRSEGVVLGEGIAPFFAADDAEAMAKACVDEGVRRVLCAGARFDRVAALDNFCWPDPIQSEKTPDGEHKLAQLVLCCRGLRDACEAYGVPLISGKDSMKNDAMLDGVKISIPPTLLVSVMGQMPDVAAALTLQPRTDGDVVWLLGMTHRELGGSSAERLGGAFSGAVPQTDVAALAAAYRAFVEARDATLVRSADALGRGGLALGLARAVLSSARSIDVTLPTLSELGAYGWLYAESTGRILFTSSAADADAVESALGDHGLLRLGVVGSRAADASLRVTYGGTARVHRTLAQLRAAYTGSTAR